MNKMHIILVVILLSACASPKTPPQSNLPTPYLPQNGTQGLHILATGTMAYPTPKQRLKTPVLLSKITQEAPTATQTATPDALWLSLAVDLRGMTEQALTATLWEDITFKKEAYALCEQLIRTSTGKHRKNAREFLKKFRWGMEFMDVGQLQEAIKILDQYN